MNLLESEVKELIALRELYFELCVNPFGNGLIICDMKYLRRMQKRLQELEKRI